MNINEKFKLIIENIFFIDLCRSIGVIANFCRGSLFIFNEKFSFVVSDFVQEYEIDILFYDRSKNKYLQSIYTVGDFFVGVDFEKNIKSDFSMVRSEINFEEIEVYEERKKESLVLFLSFLRSHGGSLYEEGVKDKRAFSHLNESIVSQWEVCMNKKVS